LVPRVKLETWEDLVHLVFKDFEVHQEEGDQEELLVLQERAESQDKTERTESQVHKDCKVCPDPWELLETRGQWVSRDNKETLEFQDPKDQEETLERMEFPEIMDHLGLLALQVTEELQEVLDPEDSRVCPALLAKMACLERMEMPVCKDHQV